MTPGDRYYVEGPLPETPEGPVRPEPWRETTVVGTRTSRVDAYERVSGAAVFPSDVALPDMLYAAILRCPHAHANVKRVDTAAAERIPGVIAVITDKTPDAAIPWYGRPGGLVSRLFDPHCRFEGEEIAAVAAESPYIARDALRAIAVEFDVLPFAVTVEDALEPAAPAIHEGGNRVGKPQVYERGDVTAGFAAADLVLEETYTTPCEIHVPAEPHGAVAKWDGPRLTVWESTQGVYPVQSGLAQALRVPLANVRVIGHYMGGGFGSKLQLEKCTVIASLLARRTGRPVKLILSREETFLCVGNRPAARITLKAGVKKDGTLTALQSSCVGSPGAYPGSGTGGIDFQVRDLYLCPNVRTESTDVYINAGPGRAFRAPGHPQGNWALEQMLDALADRLRMDPIALRLKNIPTASQLRNNQPYTSTGFRDCLVEGAKAFGWDELRRRRRATRDETLHRGVGVAGGMWASGGGSPPSTVIVKLFADGSVNLNMGASDIGTGTKTVMSMVVAEELGIPLDRIQIEHADTATTQFATPSGGSKTVPTESPAVRAAAIDIRNQLLPLAADALKAPVEDLTLANGEIVSKSDAGKKVPLGAIPGLQRRGVLVGVGYRGPNPEGKVVNPFAAHFAEVEVNARTGEVRVVRFLAAQDSGRVMNALTYESQVFGAVTMGLGFALTESRVLDREHRGRMVNANLHDYRVPTALDVPAEITCLPIDPHDTECNTAGAKGLGEPATIPVAAAIANAVFNAIGLRATNAPMTPLRIGELLASRAGAGRKG